MRRYPRCGISAWVLVTVGFGLLVASDPARGRRRPEPTDSRAESRAETATDPSCALPSDVAGVADPSVSDRSTRVRLLQRASEHEAMLQALQHERDGDLPSAMAAYTVAAQADGVLADVALYRAGVAARANGDLEGALRLVSQAEAAAHRRTSAAGRARAALAAGRWAIETGDFAAARRSLTTALEGLESAGATVGALAETAHQLVRAHGGVGDREAADALRGQIIARWPSSWAAWAAAEDLGGSAMPPDERGVMAVRMRRWNDADRWLGRTARGVRTGERAARARFYRGVAEVHLGRPNWLRTLDSVHRRYPTSSWAAAALLEAGEQLMRRGQRTAAVHRLEALERRFPGAVEAVEAAYWLTVLDRDDPRFEQRIAVAAAGGDTYAAARARSVRAGAGARPPDALGVQATITEEDLQAWARWLGLELPQAAGADLKADARVERVTTLLDLGLDDLANEEAAELVAVHGDGQPAMAFVGRLFHVRGSFAAATTWGHRLWDEVRGSSSQRLRDAPRLVQKLVAPLAFVQWVEPLAVRNGLDPLLLLALIKHESWFRPQAVSTARARGLTQFIEPTAREVAGELGLNDWQWADMDRPDVAIAFGAHYLARLQHRFLGHAAVALAAYNAGPARTAEWWSRHGDPDVFVAGIPYHETRAYVRSVLRTYDMYQSVYYDSPAP